MLVAVRLAQPKCYSWSAQPSLSVIGCFIGGQPSAAQVLLAVRPAQTQCYWRPHAQVFLVVCPTASCPARSSPSVFGLTWPKFQCPSPGQKSSLAVNQGKHQCHWCDDTGGLPNPSAMGSLPSPVQRSLAVRRAQPQCYRQAAQSTPSAAGNPPTLTWTQCCSRSAK